MFPHYAWTHVVPHVALNKLCVICARWSLTYNQERPTRRSAGAHPILQRTCSPLYEDESPIDEPIPAITERKADKIAPHLRFEISENYGSLDDPLQEYAERRMTAEAKAVYEAILEHGPLDTVRLQREARLSARSAKSRFDRALTDLQVGLKVLPVGIARAGAGATPSSTNFSPVGSPTCRSGRGLSAGERPAAISSCVTCGQSSRRPPRRRPASSVGLARRWSGRWPSWRRPGSYAPVSPSRGWRGRTWCDWHSPPPLPACNSPQTRYNPQAARGARIENDLPRGD